MISPLPAGIDILNCGSGHTEIHLDGTPAEAERAKNMIIDMLKRGYGLFINEADGSLTRVHSFDPTKLVYIVGDAPAAEPTTEETPPPKKRGRKPKREVAIGAARVTAIARTAGG